TNLCWFCERNQADPGLPWIVTLFKTREATTSHVLHEYIQLDMSRCHACTIGHKRRKVAMLVTLLTVSIAGLGAAVALSFDDKNPLKMGVISLGGVLLGGIL